MKKNLLILILFFSVSAVFSQERTITGTVTDTDGLPLIGASVVAKGAQQMGTITDVDGKFSLELPEGINTIMLSYIGYKQKEVNVADKTSVNIQMELSSTELDAVVVTALGIKKEKKALGYAFSDVSGEELTTNRDPNFINSMSNKIAGVNISQTAGGAGTSSRIVIRGIKSLSSESQPLIVVDGVPLDNSSDGATWTGGVDYGNSLMAISPDDIETMSVLKGPNAAALYGSRAATGVILITTKKGKSGKMKVTLNSNVMVDKAYVVTDYQNEYGAGFGGSIARNALTPEEQEKYGLDTAYYYYSTGSWGPRLDGTRDSVINWNGELITMRAHPDNVENYFKTGYTITNSIALENGTEKYNWRLSISDLENKGIKPNSEYNRKSVNYTMSSKLNDYISTSFKANYIREDAFNRVGQGDSRTGARTFIWMPRSIDMNTLKEDYKDENGNEQNWYKNDPWHTNPYWEAYENYNNDNKDQFIGFAKVDVELTPWLKGYVRSSMDTYSSKRYLRVANNALRAYGEGAYTERWIKYRSLNHDFLLTANKEINDDWDLSVNAGGNYYHYEVDYQSTSIDGLAVPNYFSLNNAKNPDETSAGTSKREKVIQSVYGSAQLTYKNWVYLEATARNDWSSSLPIDNNSYFYPSINTSFVFSEAFNLDEDILSFGKARFSYAFVGNDTDPHKISKRYINQAYGDVAAIYLSKEGFNPDLKSESTGSWEVGTDLRFFQNRLGLDFTYYDEVNYNQILTAEVSKASGSSRILTNGGKISNKGVELQLNATPVSTANFEWKFLVNFAKNKNEVLELAEEVSQYQITGESQISVIAQPGKPYGDIIGTRIKRYYKTDADGNILDDPNNGKYLIDDQGLYVQEERGVIGNITPDWTGGFTNNLKYKNVSLSFSVGVKMGGDIFSKTNKYGLDNGQYVETLEGRESWYNATQEERDEGSVGYVAEGVKADGTPNDKGIDPQVYFHQRKWGGIAELDVYDASYVKLRDVTLNYNFPSYWFENNFISKASLAFVAKNVWLIYSGVPNIDPESSFSSNNNALGQEYAALPPTRSFGFNLRLVF